ncbi:DUF7017 domain-containing protein [Bacillus cereus]|uniref:tetratricopeptide repeat protein n=1 Tax=Bacillus cereus TaxID=1396 RepID=UPI003F50EF33
MTELYQQKELATKYRKNENYKEALPLYKALWEKTRDKYDAAGYLHCLRKLQQYDEAIPLAKELEREYSDFNWCRIEIIWTYISGILNNLDEKDSLGKTLQVSRIIMNLNPDEVALQKTVFTVLKKAKQFKKWDVICEWINKLDPEELTDVSIKTQKGDTGWSYQLIWYHYKVRCLIYQGKFGEAIELADVASRKSNQKEKYFQRLKATALQNQGDFQSAAQIFKELCSSGKVDWWILYDYALLLNHAGEKEMALQKMYKAASFAFRLEGILSMLQDIALINKELNRKEEAFYHLQLCKTIREKNGWMVSEQLLRNLQELNKAEEYPSKIEFREARRRCEGYWGKNEVTSKRQKERKKVRKGLKGKLTQVKEAVPFCFIQTKENESFFCYVNDVEGQLGNGTLVTFDVIPAFDKKKQKESWKAINVSLAYK